MSTYSCQHGLPLTYNPSKSCGGNEEGGARGEQIRLESSFREGTNPRATLSAARAIACEKTHQTLNLMSKDS